MPRSKFRASPSGYTSDLNDRMTRKKHVVFSRRRWLWFDPYIRHYVRKRVHQVLVDGSLPQDDKVLHVIMAQHVSRFDGFIIRMIQRSTAPSARLITIMLDEQINRNPVFKKAGALGITPGSLASVRRLKQTVASEMKGGDYLVIFPQGRIETVDADPHDIQEGYRHLVHPVLPTRFIPVALSVEALTHPKPSIFVRIGDPAGVDEARGAFADTVSGLRRWLRSEGESADTAWPGRRVL